MVKEEQQKSNIKINELINKIKVLEEDKKTILNENNNKENIIIESNKYIEEYKMKIKENENKIENLNQIVSKIEEKKNQKISLIFELDKSLFGIAGQKKQFIIKEKRNKKLIQIIFTLFNKYPFLKNINIKSFENKKTGNKIYYYGDPKENNLEDNNIISINLE